MSPLMRSVSGIRGIVGESLTPPVIIAYTNAFLQITAAKKIVIGRDSRVSGPMVEDLVAACCSASGVDAIRLGLSSTPTVEMAVDAHRAGGGIIVTASHNPFEWNALKFLTGEGIFLDEKQIAALFELVDAQKYSWTGAAKLGALSTVTADQDADQYHIDHILALPYIDVDAIRNRKFRVAYDAVNGAGSLIVPKLLRSLGCEVFAIHSTPNGIFPHNPEPSPENLRDLSDTVIKEHCDVGFATDPDADRCALVDEKGKALSEEYTLVLASDLVLRKTKGTMTVNLSTSRMIEDLAKKFGVTVERAKVGEINVTVVMKKNHSVVGGEGNGGVILPALHYGRDGVLAVAMTLQLMLSSDSLSQIISEYPPYYIEKQKFALNNTSLNILFGRLLAKMQGATVDEQDGLRFEWGNKWVHVRASNTEPVIRVIAEASEADEARRLCKLIQDELG